MRCARPGSRTDRVLMTLITKPEQQQGVHRDLSAEPCTGGPRARKQQHARDRLVQAVHRVQLPQVWPERLVKMMTSTA